MKLTSSLICMSISKNKGLDCLLIRTAVIFALLSFYLMISTSMAQVNLDYEDEENSLQYYSDGTLKRELKNEDEDDEILVIEYYPNGNVKSFETYRAEQHDRYQYTYYENGAMKEKSLYIEGILLNVMKYDLKGNRIGKGLDKNGPFSIDHDNGKIKIKFFRIPAHFIDFPPDNRYHKFIIRSVFEKFLQGVGLNIPWFYESSPSCCRHQ